MENNKRKKHASIALLGPPNAGKSTVLNSLLGQKISIVTPKAQTTRTVIKGILTREDKQLIFIDTPGLFKAQFSLEKAIINEAWQGIHQAEHHILILDVKKIAQESTQTILTLLKKQKLTTLLLLNKIDKIHKEQLLPIVAQLYKTGLFSEVFMISALKKQGLDDLLNYLFPLAKKEGWLFAEDQCANISQKFLAAEITREKIFLCLEQEIPYGIAVETEKWQEKKESITLHQVIYTRKKNHKAMLIGKQGAMLKKIGAAARRSLEKQMGKTIHLFLFVKIDEHWLTNVCSWQSDIA